MGLWKKADVSSADKFRYGVIGGLFNTLFGGRHVMVLLVLLLLPFMIIAELLKISK